MSKLKTFLQGVSEILHLQEGNGKPRKAEPPAMAISSDDS